MPKHNQNRRHQYQWGSHMRGQKPIMQMQNPLYASQSGRYEGSQIRSHNFSEYAPMRVQVDPNRFKYTSNPSQWKRQKYTRFRSQNYAENPQMQMKESTHFQTKMNKTYLRQYIWSTRHRRPTKWEEWIPPHLITDSSETTGTGPTRSRTGTRGSNSTDSNESNTTGTDFNPNHDPNDPKYDYTASVST